MGNTKSAKPTQKAQRIRLIGLRLLCFFLCAFCVPPHHSPINLMPLALKRRAKFKYRYRGIGSDRPQKCQQTWLTLYLVCPTVCRSDSVDKLPERQRDDKNRIPGHARIAGRRLDAARLRTGL